MAVTSLGTHKIEKIYINNNEYFLINSFVTTNIINTGGRYKLQGGGVYKVQGGGVYFSGEKVSERGCL